MALLTPRQAEVLALAAEGHSRADTAARLNIKRDSLNHHLFEIYKRLGVSACEPPRRNYWALAHAIDTARGMRLIPRADEEERQ